MRSPASLLVPLLVAAALGAAWPVSAQSTSPEARARELFELGTKEFDESRYDKAEAAFSEAYELSHRAGFLWNMAQCARLRGNGARALQLYRQYLDKSPNGSERAEAMQWVERLEAELAAPPPSVASTVPVSSPEPAAEPERGHWMSDPTLPWVLGGIGVAGFAVGGVTGVMALGKGSTVDKECDASGCSSAGKEAADSGKTLATVSNVGFGVGLAGAAAAVVLLLAKPEPQRLEQATRWTPTVAYDGNGGWVGASGTW